MSYAARLFTGLSKPLLMMFLSDSITHYPGGDLGAGVAVDALIALDNELGTNEAAGDGAITRGTEGDRERRTGRIEVDASLTITENDLWRINGKLWTTQREDAADAGTNPGFQGWRITTKLGRRTQHSIVKGTRPINKV